MRVVKVLIICGKNEDIKRLKILIEGESTNELIFKVTGGIHPDEFVGCMVLNEFDIYFINDMFSESYYDGFQLAGYVSKEGCIGPIILMVDDCKNDIKDKAEDSGIYTVFEKAEDFKKGFLGKCILCIMERVTVLTVLQKRLDEMQLKLMDLSKELLKIVAMKNG